MNFLGPLTLNEGQSENWGVVLDSKPTHAVTVSINIEKPRSDTPSMITLTPSIITFQPNQWNVKQLVKMILQEDDVDNKFDSEAFNCHTYQPPMIHSIKVVAVIPN